MNPSIVGKFIITGKMRLLSPLLIGTGSPDEARNERDIQVLRDREGHPIIPGSSLAGVLRDFFRRQNPAGYTVLFGSEGNAKKEIYQSAVAIDDVKLSGGEITFRDGVSIDAYTGTAVMGMKYDYEAVERGAVGDFSLMVTERAFMRGSYDIDESVQTLLDFLAGGFSVGALTAVGFGRVRCEELAAGYYDFAQKENVLAWLSQEEPDAAHAAKRFAPRAEELPLPGMCRVTADFALRTSLLVRDQDVSDAKLRSAVDDYDLLGKNRESIDTVQRMSGKDYLVPGRSIKGILRKRAVHILRAICRDITGMQNAAVQETFIDRMMGMSDKKAKQKSRLSVSEMYLSKKDFTAAVQPRVRIDRFVGGHMDSALFFDAPIWQKEKDRAGLHLALELRASEDTEEGRARSEAEIGLLLLLLKDLWRGNIAIGGGKSVGRGRLIGKGAVMELDGTRYRLDADGKLVEGDAARLEEYIAALRRAMEKTEVCA
ncbi:CRISPR-associated RAMP protein [Selenomonas sp. oral taxon 137 str. F0430]|uniref:RAMP superfamily CRISPR-associated protein n=1 Tax=Selenomonas sp. oral taxon 137 TaxID=712531 RepID=UPI0001EB244A|nr:RAMP superfamily CRISPR-associated protein [Selenomonas sp. oral taxon 137]EFR41977.1 CRISPR-associated RAMP protein [Selenomonas sp. oral taxon 137 str. F0430]